jgi:hypothetical protein
MAMAGGDTVMARPTPLEHMPAMPLAARTMAIIPIATATTPTVATDAFWFATRVHELGADRLCPANIAMDIVSALAARVRATETGLVSAVALARDVNKAAVARQISFLEQHYSKARRAT